MGFANQNMGFFITVEGGEGVGKTTFIREFSKVLEQICKKKSQELVLTREPGGTPTAELMRPIFSQARTVDPLDIRAEFLLVSAARAQHVAKVILPKLANGAMILCDRFVDSSRVYQGILGGISEEEIESVTRTAAQGVEPHLTFLLHADVDTVLQRLNNRHDGNGEERSRFDMKPRAFHESLLQAYLTLQKKFSRRMVQLDATQSVERIVTQAKQALEGKLLKK